MGHFDIPREDIFSYSSSAGPQKPDFRGVESESVKIRMAIKASSSHLILLQASSGYHLECPGSMGRGTLICKKKKYFQIPAPAAA